jgi:hypothetical protein
MSMNYKSWDTFAWKQPVHDDIPNTPNNTTSVYEMLVTFSHCDYFNYHCVLNQKNASSWGTYMTQNFDGGNGMVLQLKEYLPNSVLDVK